MNKPKSANTALAVIAILIVVAGLFLLSRKQEQAESTSGNQGMILFYSLSCPHCQNVEQYIETNKVKEKYSFDRLEVSKNQNNSAQLAAKARACGLDTQGIGVPFLWTGEKCLMGDTDIIEFFQQ